MTEERNLVIVTHGIDDGVEQMSLALQYGITLVNMNMDVTLFLTGLAVRWSYKEMANLRGKGGFVAAMEYLSMFINGGGVVKVCTTCYEDEMLTTHKEGKIADTLIEGVKFSGLTEIVEMSLDSKVMVF